MTNTEAARYRAYGLAIEHLKQYPDITGTIPAFKEVLDEAIAIFSSITGTDLPRLLKSQTGSAGKQQFRDELVKNAVLIASAVLTYASRNNKKELLQSMSYTRSELEYANDADLGGRAGNILATAKQLNGSLQPFGVSDTLLKSFDEQVSNYVPLAARPRTLVSERKAAGLAAKEQLDKLANIFDYQLDSMMLHLQAGNPDFYNTYVIKRTVVNPARRKTRIEGTITDKDGNALGNVNVRIKDSLLTTISLTDGSYTIKTPVLNAATVEFSKEGFKPVTVVVDVKRGQALSQSIVMERP